MDESFVAFVEPFIPIHAVAPFGDKVLAAGHLLRNRICRLNADGSSDDGFDAAVEGAVRTISVRPDGTILAGGLFSAMGNHGTADTTRHNLGLLTAAASLDPTFNPGANGEVRAFAVQRDGAVLVGGSFTTVGGGGTGTITRHRIARVASTLGTAPLIVGISPEMGSTAGGTAVTISGFNFQPGAALTIGGVPARSVSVVRPTTITAMTGPHGSGPADVLVTNPDLQVATHPGAFKFGPIISVDRKALAFTARTDGAAFINQTGSQEIRITQSGPGVVSWTARSSRSWLVVSPESGIGPATLRISVRHRDGPAFVLSGKIGEVAITLQGAGSVVAPIPVTIGLVPVASTVSPPFGSFDTPTGDGMALAGSIAVTGWTLDDIGVKRVEIWRDLQPGEPTAPFASTPSDPRAGKVFISNATFVAGARPDVEGLHPTTPANYKAGWGYLLLTNGLFGQGNGTYKLSSYAFDEENNISTIGSKTMVIDNNGATKPFGSIDTPGIGGDAGTAPNFGWALTPKVNGAATCRIGPNGVQVSIDSGPLQAVVYGDARTDVAAAFPGFSNTAAAGGHFVFDWSTLTNGAHTIGWLVTDDCNRADGVGSRFFNVTTGTSLVTAPVDSRLKAETRPDAEFRLKAETTGREEARALPVPTSVASASRRTDTRLLLSRGYGELPAVVDPDAAGSRTIEVKQGERIELRLPRGFDHATQVDLAGERRSLPIGSTWDMAAGIFYWQPAPGFLGTYRLVFSNGAERVSVRVVVSPSGE